MKKKILFIIQSYPSERSANVYCDENVMNALNRTGKYDIHCLVMQYAEQPLEQILNGYHIHRIKRSLWWKAFTKAKRNETDDGSKNIIKLNKFFMRLKETLFIPMYPIYEPLLVHLYASEAIKCHKNYSFDLVVSEFYGCETLLAGYKLKCLYPEIKYVPIFWDALSGGFGVKYLPKAYTRYKRIILERKVVSRCDKAIALRSHEQQLQALWKQSGLFDKFRFLDIPRLEWNSVEYGKSQQFVFDDRKINIVFAGSMTLRNPEPLFSLISKLDRSKFIIWFFTAQIYFEKIKKLQAAYDVNVVLNNYISHEELKKVLGQADALLNIGTDNECMIPSKIFEYMSYRKPIISLYVSDKDPSLPYFQHYPAAFLIKAKEKISISDFTLFISEIKGKSVDFPIDDSFFYANQPAAYVEAIEDILYEKR